MLIANGLVGFIGKPKVYLSDLKRCDGIKAKHPSISAEDRHHLNLAESEEPEPSHPPINVLTLRLSDQRNALVKDPPPLLTHTILMPAH